MKDDFEIERVEKEELIRQRDEEVKKGAYISINILVPAVPADAYEKFGDEADNGDGTINWKNFADKALDYITDNVEYSPSCNIIGRNVSAVDTAMALHVAEFYIRMKLNEHMINMGGYLEDEHGND